MRYPVDLSLFDRGAHNPSFFSIRRSLGNEGKDLVDFCVPCNPYFPTPEMFAAWSAALPDTLKYYPSDRGVIGHALAEFLGADPDTLVLANGSTELITWLDHLFISGTVATPVPTFGRWTDQPKETGKQVALFPLAEANGYHLEISRFLRFVEHVGAKAVVICNPNNPTGGYVPKGALTALLDELAALELIVIDESFIDFVDMERAPSLADEAVKRKNVVVLKSLGKNFGLHGLRFGYAAANPAIIRLLAGRLPPWNINALAEQVLFSVKDHRAAYEASLRRLSKDRAAMESSLRRLPGISLFPSQANFALIKLPADRDAIECRNYLLTEHGLFVRECGNKIGMGEGFLRVATRPPHDVARLLEGLDAYLMAPVPAAIKTQPWVSAS